MKNIRSLAMFACLAAGLYSCKEAAKHNSSPVSLSDAGANAISVYLTKNHKGEPVIAWSQEDTLTKKISFYYTVIPQPGKSNDELITVPIEQNAALHAEGMPKIAFRKNGDVFAVYEVKIKSATNPYAGEIHYIYSTDGKNWSQPARVHADSSKDKGRSFFDITSLSNGEIGICWLDTSFGTSGRPVKFAQTAANHSFVGETVVDSLACECCRTAITSGPDGRIDIVFRDILNDSIRDISVSSSSNQGNSFTQAQCFSGDNWNINGCPHNGPDVVSDNNNIYASWFTGSAEHGVYYCELARNGKSINKKLLSAFGRYAQLAILRNGKRVVAFNQSNSSASSPIFVKTFPGEVIKRVSDSAIEAKMPVIIDNGNGFIVAWIQEQGNIGRVFYDSRQE